MRGKSAQTSATEKWRFRISIPPSHLHTRLFFDGDDALVELIATPPGTRDRGSRFFPLLGGPEGPEPALGSSLDQCGYPLPGAPAAQAPPLPPSLPDGCSPPTPGAARSSGKDRDGRPSDKCRCLPAASTCVSARLPLRLAPDVSVRVATETVGGRKGSKIAYNMHRFCAPCGCMPVRLNLDLAPAAPLTKP